MEGFVFGPEQLTRFMLQAMEEARRQEAKEEEKKKTESSPSATGDKEKEKMKAPSRPPLPGLRAYAHRPPAPGELHYHIEFHNPLSATPAEMVLSMSQFTNLRAVLNEVSCADTKDITLFFNYASDRVLRFETSDSLAADYGEGQSLCPKEKKQ